MELKKLKQELKYKWRVQSINDKKAICVAYIDSRQVQELLDEVVGIENWQSDYKEVKSNIYAGIGILINGNWVWKWDCGVESKQDAEKGEASDSFKRAAVKWGIGRFLYELGIETLDVINKNNKNYPKNSNTGTAIYSGSDLTTYIFNKNANTHNRNSLIEDGKPLITNRQFKTLLDRINTGDKEAIEKAKKAFSFDSTQLSILEEKQKAA